MLLPCVELPPRLIAYVFGQCVQLLICKDKTTNAKKRKVDNFDLLLSLISCFVCFLDHEIPCLFVLIRSAPAHLYIYIYIYIYMWALGESGQEGFDLIQL